jgi:hypothetical protein
MLCAGTEAQLTPEAWTRCFARAAFAFAPETYSDDGDALPPADKLRWLLEALPERAAVVKLPVLA